MGLPYVYIYFLCNSCISYLVAQSCIKIKLVYLLLPIPIREAIPVPAEANLTQQKAEPLLVPSFENSVVHGNSPYPCLV